MMSDPKSRSRFGGAPLATVRSVSQVMLSFHSEDPGRTFTEIRNEALKWLANRAGRKLPERAWAGESFDMLEAGAQPVSAIALDQPAYWCFRASDADKEVARRHWTTETGILLNDDEVLFGCRLQCVALGESPEFNASIPRVVAQVVKNQAAYLDGRRISTQAWNVTSGAEVDDFVALLLNPQRTRPVIAVSLGDREGHDGPGAIDADRLARQTLGAAHVVTLSGDASYALTDRLGREFSVFHQAVRTYRPGVDPNIGSSTDHPIALPRTIETWTDGGAEAFTRFLVERALRGTVLGVDIYGQLPSFADVHAQAAKRRRTKAKEEGASDTELLALALEENERLEEKLKDEKQTYEGLLETAERERVNTEVELDETRASYRGLQARVEHLEAALSATGKQDETPILDTFEGLDAWCAEHLSGRVQVLPRALRAAVKSSFENPPLAYQALLILRDYFVPMKREGGMEKKQAYEQALAELGLEDTPSIVAERAGEFSDEYSVTYNGRSRILERHLKGSSSREERFGFRLYFFWDDDTRQVVVGSFPAHLSTRAS